MNRGSGRSIPFPHWSRPYLKILRCPFSLLRPSSIIPAEDPLRVPSFRVPVAVSRGRMVGDPLDEGVKRLHIRDVLPAQAGESGAELLVEPDAVRREPVPELPGESTTADVPIRQDDCFAVAARDRLAQPEDRRAFVDEPDVPGQAEGPQRASIVLPFYDDRSEAVLLCEVFDHLLEIHVKLFPVHQTASGNGLRHRLVGCIANEHEPCEDDKGCAATPSYIGRRILAACRARRRSILNASRRCTGRKAARRPW